MGNKGKKVRAGKPKKLTPKDVGKRLDVLVRKLEEELKGADIFASLHADGKHPGNEFIRKHYLDSAYRACHGAQMEVKSEEREKHGYY